MGRRTEADSSTGYTVTRARARGHTSEPALPSASVRLTLLTHWRDLDPSELKARLRALQMGARLLCGQQAAPLIAALALAEGDPAALADADAEMDRLPTLAMRRLLSTFAATLRTER